MKLFEIVAEFHGNKEVTVNGRPLQGLKDCDIPVEEKVIEKNVSLEQQWFLLCEVRKLIGRLEFTYHKSRLRAGGATDSRLITSGAKGVGGTSIGKLPGSK